MEVERPHIINNIGDMKLDESDDTVVKMTSHDASGKSIKY